MPGVLAVLALSSAFLLLARPRVRLTGSSGSVTTTLAPWALAMAVLVVAAVLDRLALGVVLAAAGLATKALWSRQHAARVAAARADRVAELCDALAGDLAAGLPTQHALVRGAGDFPEFVALAGAAELGSDVPDTLRELARTPGCGELRLVAASWQVAHRTGAGLAEALDRAADGVRARRRTDRMVAGELASAQATARVMAVLPMLFTVAGAGLGADPIGFLTDGPAGLTCLAVGLALTFAGLFWLQRMADEVGRR